MTLVRELARRWGVTDEEDGKTVWFVLPAARSARTVAT
jgi:hypothetical protein